MGLRELLYGNKEKTIVIEKGVNWEKMLIDIGNGVTRCETEIGHTKGDVGTLRKDLNDHCISDGANKVKLKNDICKKIDNIKCPDAGRVTTLEGITKGHDKTIKDVKKKSMIAVQR